MSSKMNGGTRTGEAGSSGRINSGFCVFVSAGHFEHIMQIHAITQLLLDRGVAAPELRVLHPNHENYSVLLFQPQGDIHADESGVRNLEPDLARQQHSAFLGDAAAGQIALAITPEYSTPWSTLENAIRNGVVP